LSYDLQAALTRHPPIKDGNFVVVRAQVEIGGTAIGNGIHYVSILP
jgi:hypothetical protein